MAQPVFIFVAFCSTLGRRVFCYCFEYLRLQIPASGPAEVFLAVVRSEQATEISHCRPSGRSFFGFLENVAHRLGRSLPPLPCGLPRRATDRATAKRVAVACLVPCQIACMRFILYNACPLIILFIGHCHHPSLGPILVGTLAAPQPNLKG
ncbi:hypothetical protein ISCGN_017961 [Ixodes scapularis]